MNTLVDAGPLIALIDRGQGDLHRVCVTASSAISGPLLTTWPCLTEAMHFLGNLRGWTGQEALWRFVDRGALRIHAPTESEALRMRALMQTYADTPMDLADASLVAVAEALRLYRIFTLDRDFRVYRINGVTPFEVVP
ncbi:putative nucleic acid-binding protein, contains PIN domain [Candidatus Sulfopaludibacter sp. SbA4]|nr:putative nucleic acid-binding protein, contains PIN domain [Candidatus Sulfopaludibacter sp. SbA4]